MLIWGQTLNINFKIWLSEVTNLSVETATIKSTVAVNGDVTQRPEDTRQQN